MLRILALTTMAVCFTLGASAQQMTGPDVQDLIGRNASGLKEWTQDDKAKQLTDKIFPNQRPLGNGRWIVRRDEDQGYQHCVAVAEGSWLIDGRLSKISDPQTGLAQKLIAATGWGGIAECNARWVEKVYDVYTAANVKMISATVDATAHTDAKILAALNKLLDQDGAVNIVLSRLSAKSEDVTNDMGVLNQQTVKLTEIVKSIVDDHEKEKLLNEQKQNIEAAAQLTQLVSRLAFKNDPEAQYKIKVGTDAVSSIATNVLSLSNATQLGAQVVSGVGIASAALSLFSMLGPGEDPTASLIQSGFQSVREDIHDLSGHIDKRFDNVEKILAAMSDQIDKRLGEIDTKLNSVHSEIESFRETWKKHTGIDESALAEIITAPFIKSYRICSNENGKKTTIDDVNVLRSCLIDYEQFAGSGASQQVLNGSIFFDFERDPERAVETINDVKFEYRVGFLWSSLVNSQARVGPVPSDLGASPLSPYMWADVADAFLHTVELGPKMVHPASIPAVTRISQPELRRLIEDGIASRGAVKALRDRGVAEAIEIYARNEKIVADRLAKLALSDVAERNLNELQSVEYRDVIAGYPNNDTLNFSMRRGSKLVFMKDTGFDGQFVAVEGLRILNNPMSISASGGSSVITPQWVDGMLVQFETNYIYDEKNYPIGKYGPLVPTDPIELRKAIAGANSRYLELNTVSSLTSEARKAARASIAHVGNFFRDEQLRDACARLSESQLYLAELAMLERGAVSSDEEWVKALSAVVGGGSPASPCVDVFNVVSSTLQPIGLKEDVKLEIYLANWIQRILDDKVRSFVSAYDVPRQSNSVPVIDARIGKLQALVEAGNTSSAQ